jgi:hypothetical protein
VCHEHSPDLLPATVTVAWYFGTCSFLGIFKELNLRSGRTSCFP